MHRKTFSQQINRTVHYYSCLTGRDEADAGSVKNKTSKKSDNAGEDVIRAYMNSRVSRRTALGTGAKVGIGVVVAAVAGVGIYEAYAASTATSSTNTSSTISTSQAITTTSTTSSSAPPTGTTSTSATSSPSGSNKLTFVHWSFENATITQYVNTFDSETNFSTTEQLLNNSNYTPLLEADFASGAKVDMCYANGYEVPRLIALGYARNLSTMSGISQIESEMYPSIVSSLNDTNGNLTSLCYFWTPEPALIVDDAIVNQTSRAGADPMGWIDLYTNAAPAVAKSGIVQYPIMPNWYADDVGIGWGWLTETGNANNDPDQTQTGFNKQFQPVFDTNSPAADMLQTWATATKDGLVDPSVFSMSCEACTTAAGATNKYAYVSIPTYDWVTMVTPSSTSIPTVNGNPGSHLVNVSSEQSSLGMIDTGNYVWPVNVNNETGSEDLVKWFGYEDPTTGQRVTQTQWAVDAMLGSGYPCTLENPSVISAYQGWFGGLTTQTLDTLTDITNGDLQPYSWKGLIYAPFVDTGYPVMSSVASGTTSVSSGVTTLLNLANSLWESTYGSSSSTST